SKHKRKEHQAEELQPRNAQRADIIPTEGFAMVVDGKLKGNFADEQAAKRRAKTTRKIAEAPRGVFNAKTRFAPKSVPLNPSYLCLRRAA
ncbi:MAG TPA: hypothetical protein VFS91_10985, partial [Nitrobacter sp.]|nr:hypothetical protein [Nitrobacter sp.]